MAEGEVEMVRRHVREGARHVANQRRIVREIEGRGGDDRLAKTLLTMFEGLQEQHRAHLVRLTGEGL